MNVKQRFIIIAIAAMAIAECCIFAGCTKEPAIGNEPSKGAFAISNSSNPYDYCGQIHNEILDYIIEETTNPSCNDIFTLTKEYLLNNYNMNSTVSLSEVGNGFDIITEIVTYSLLEKASFSQMFSSEVVSNTFDSIASYAYTMISTNKLFSPVEYAGQLVVIENRIYEDRLNSGISADSVTDYDIALAALAIARYSYSYWYEVAADPDNPWNNASDNLKSHNEDGDNPRGFWGKLWDGLCDVVTGVTQIVVQVAVTPIVDAAGFVYGGATPHGPENFGLTLTIGDGIERAGNWSGNVWKWEDWRN